MCMFNFLLKFTSFETIPEVVFKLTESYDLSNVAYPFRNTVKLSTGKEASLSSQKHLLFSKQVEIHFQKSENCSIVQVKSYFHIYTHDLNFYDLRVLQEILFLFRIFSPAGRNKQNKDIKTPEKKP